MINCPRCGRQVDNTAHTTCPLCYTPLNVQQMVHPQSSQALSAPGMAPVRPGGRVSLTGEVVEHDGLPPPPVTSGTAAGGSAAGSLRAPSGGPAAPRRNAHGMYSRAEAVPDNSRRNALLINLGVALFLGLLCVGGGRWYWLHRTNPKAQVVRYLHATQWLDWRVVYELSATRPGNKTRSEFVGMMNDKFDNNGLFKIIARHRFEKITFAVGEPAIHDDEATVPVTVGGSRVKSDRALQFRLRNFGGFWKIEPLAENPLEVIGAEDSNSSAAAFSTMSPLPGGGRR
jgi:hypothetical protein